MEHNGIYNPVVLVNCHTFESIPSTLFLLPTDDTSVECSSYPYM